MWKIHDTTAIVEAAQCSIFLHGWLVVVGFTPTYTYGIQKNEYRSHIPCIFVNGIYKTFINDKVYTRQDVALESGPLPILPIETDPWKVMKCKRYTISTRIASFCAHQIENGRMRVTFFQCIFVTVWPIVSKLKFHGSYLTRSNG